VESSAAAACWSTPINVSENSGESFAPAITSDGTAIYLAWSDATGYVRDWALGTENIFFRRVERDGSLTAPVVDIPKSALGTNRNFYPNLVAHGGSLAMAYAAQAGTMINSDGQARFIRLDLTGVALGAPVVVNDDIVAPSPGTTALGYAHELTFAPGPNQFLFSVYGKYPWGGGGAWNRGTYFVDGTTGTRVGKRACFNNCGTMGALRPGHATGVGRAIYRPAPNDWVTYFQADNSPYLSTTWIVRFRRVDRADATVGGEIALDTLTNGVVNDTPQVDAAWSESLGAFVAM
jgi:hypothetical protein